MKTFTEKKIARTMPAGVAIKRYVGTFADFRRILKESIEEIEKKSCLNKKTV